MAKQNLFYDVNDQSGVCAAIRLANVGRVRLVEKHPFKLQWKFWKRTRSDMFYLKVYNNSDKLIATLFYTDVEEAVSVMDELIEKEYS